MNNTVRQQLLYMQRRDQKMRKGSKWNARIDRQNTAVLKKIIKKYGWPNSRLVGEKGAAAAWLIAQHADHDIKFQRKCLRLMRDPGSKKFVSPWQIAYLTDRVRVHEGKKQLFGTQFYRTSRGVIVPRPIIDKRTLGARRKRMGLGPFERYRQELLEMLREKEIRK